MLVSLDGKLIVDMVTPQPEEVDNENLPLCHIGRKGEIVASVGMQIEKIQMRHAATILNLEAVQLFGSRIDPRTWERPSKQGSAVDPIVITPEVWDKMVSELVPHFAVSALMSNLMCPSVSTWCWFVHNVEIKHAIGGQFTDEEAERINTLINAWIGKGESRDFISNLNDYNWLHSLLKGQKIDVAIDDDYENKCLRADVQWLAPEARRNGRQYRFKNEGTRSSVALARAVSNLLTSRPDLMQKGIVK